MASRFGGGIPPPPRGLVAFVSLLLIFLMGPYVCDSAGYTNAVVGNNLLYSTTKDIMITSTNRSPKPTIVYRGLEEGATVDFYSEGRLICWTDMGLEKIRCISYNATHTDDRVVFEISDLNSPVGLAVDWYTQKMYWAHRNVFDMFQIEVCSFSKKHRKVLFWTDIDMPRAIAVAPMKGLLFWTDWGEDAKIERAGMNGEPETRKTIVQKNIFWPNGLTIDYENEKVYWLDAKLHFIDMIDFDGKNRKTIVRDTEKLVYGYALTFFNNRLYWTDWKTWYIHSWDMNTKGPVRNLTHCEVPPGDVKVWNHSRQKPPPFRYPCHDNGNCSHLCLLSPNSPGYSCACPSGIRLLNETHCADSPQTQIVLVLKMALVRISLDSPDYTSFIIPLQNIESAVAVDYDPVEEFIYWTDDHTKTISRSRLNGSEQSVVIKGDLGNLDGLAIDNAARNLYWTDPVADTITAARLDGSSRKVLINEDLDNPRAIAVAPTLGWMFWSDWSKPPKIERASLDGSNRTLIISENISWPNGIALDVKAKKLYWGDAQYKKIEVCNMDGSDRRVLISDNLEHLFGLSLLGDYIYWTEWQARSLTRIHKTIGADKEIIVESVPNVMGVKALDLGEKSVTNPCSFNNGNCSHFCFYRPDGFVCDCPIGLEMGKNNKTCVKPAAFILYIRKDKISRLSIENLNKDVTLPIKDIKLPTALTIHAAETRLYWIDSKTQSINRCAINDTNSEKVFESSLIENLALDWCGRNLYWTESSNRIEVLRLDKPFHRTLIWQGLRKPKSLALHPLKGYMYWSEWGTKTIKYANMDGSSPKVLIESVGRAVSLTIDFEFDKLYWIAIESAVIEMASLDGTNRKTLISSNIEAPCVMTLYNDYIYWADHVTGVLESALKTNGENRTKIYFQLDSISDMVMYHQSRQIGTNACSVNNGGCSHLCLSSSNSRGYKCACMAHYTLRNDNVTCSAPNEFVLYSHRNGIGRVVFSNQTYPDTVLSTLKSVKAIEYDPINRNIFWLDSRTHSIKYMPDNGVGNTTVLIGNVDTSADMALDAIGRTLYFTSPETNSINITKLDNNSNVGVIMRNHKSIPKFIVVHEIRRMLFWADIKKGVIISSAVDGSNQKEVIGTPNISTLTLNPFTDTIYWANGKQIYSCSINGTNKTLIWKGGAVTSLSVLHPFLYWIDGEKQLTHIPLIQKDAPALSITKFLHLTDVVAVHKVDHKNNPCMTKANCDGVCLADGSCACVRGISYGSKCSEPLPCKPDQFACISTDIDQTKMCFPNSWRCDGTPDCYDKVDEIGCTVCPQNKFSCRDETCIDDILVCDGKKHCADGSDEKGCCNGPNHFKCQSTGNCISGNDLCDQWADCGDPIKELPEFCSQKRFEASPINMKILYIFVLLGIILILFPAAGILYCRRKLAANRFCPNDRAGDPLSPKQTSHDAKIGSVRPSTSSNLRSSKMSSKLMDGMKMSTLNSSSTNSYDRKHITGASSSATNGSSYFGRYPREPLNPPPSPATTAHSCSATTRHKPYRHYRFINQPPPPTPCSTDVCDESDCTISYPTYGLGNYLEAPPPTPCPTSPPSPSSRSSAYFSPLPPPPSPVPPHYSI